MAFFLLNVGAGLGDEAPSRVEVGGRAGSDGLNFYAAVVKTN